MYVGRTTRSISLFANASESIKNLEKVIICMKYRSQPKHYLLLRVLKPLNLGQNIFYSALNTSPNIYH